MSSIPPPPDSPQQERRSAARWIVGLSAAIALLLSGGALWWIGNRERPPDLPDLHLSGADPEVAEAVRRKADAVRRRPRSAAAWGELGMVLLGNKFVEEALPVLARAEELDAADPRWPYLQGIGLLGQDPERALPCLRRTVAACQRDPSRFAGEVAVARLRLAETLSANGHSAEAEAQFQEVPDGPLAPCASYGLGVLAVQQDDLAAGQRFLAACADSPLTRQKACVQLAALSRRLGDEEAAHDYAQQASQLPPDAAWPDPLLKECLSQAVGKESRLQLASTLEGQGDLDGALDVLRGVVRDYPEAQSLLALGITLGRRGYFQESEASLHRALELEPRLLRAQYYLSLALLAQGEMLQQQGRPAEARAKFEQAAEWAEQATELAPRYGEAHFQLGLCLWSLQRREAAIESFRQAVATRPDLADAHLWLGRLLAEGGNKEEAVRHVRDALRYAHPDDPRPRQALARLTEE